jgi:hypothetical protein
MADKHGTQTGEERPYVLREGAFPFGLPERPPGTKLDYRVKIYEDLPERDFLDSPTKESAGAHDLHSSSGGEAGLSPRTTGGHSPTSPERNDDE